MQETFTYCIGVDCNRKFNCKRRLGNYSEPMPEVKRIDGVNCFTQKGQLTIFETNDNDFFIGNN